jgi:hypothetical protein
MLLDRIDQRAEALQQTVKCPGAQVLVDELGAQPTACAAAAPAQQPAGGSRPEATPQPAAPNGATPTAPAEIADGQSPAPSEVESSSSPGTAGASDESGGDGVVESIKKALESIFN